MSVVVVETTTMLLSVTLTPLMRLLFLLWCDRTVTSVFVVNRLRT